ncbi:MAG TPA: DUF6056 family protein [Kofleriaceae bacterium]|nr:DUF6056 family protein [Kofleriaceae bacterium]
MRTERAICAGAIALLWLFFFVQALHTPTLLDDWYQLTWHRHHSLNLSSIWEYGHYNYFNFNPRIGDVLLMIINGPRWIHLLLTPLVQLAVLPLAFIAAFGRLPRLAYRDMSLLLVVQVLLWLVMPIPGIVYFYRPFTTNYIWAFVLMLALFAPYRLALARDDAGPARHWLAPLMLPLGWLAGMGNEHTGPTAMLAMAVFLYVAWRKRRLRPWMIAGAIGLYIGYPMLFFAPGQHLRYAGMATRNTPSYLLTSRGFDGTFEILLDFVAETQIALNLVLIALLVGIKRSRATLGGLSRTQLVTVLALIGAALGMVATLFASPTVGERLFFAPAVLFVGALLVIVDWLWAEKGARRVIVIGCVVLGLYQAERMIVVLADGYEQNQTRMAMLRNAPADSVVNVPPYALWKRSRYWWGDDFQYASLREYVANEVYDLKGIEYDRPLHWVEPSPHDRFVVQRTFDPPLPPNEDAQLQPRYIPTFWEWALVQLRRSMKLGPIAFVTGHRLVHYTVDLVDSPIEDPLHRPIHVFDWTPDKLTFVDGRMFDDPNGNPNVRVWQPSVPPSVVDVFVEGCGTTQRVELKPDSWDHIGPLIPIDLACPGTFTTVMCQVNQCWFSGRYWR